jgi:Protein of unknown function (DUF3489)
MLRRPKGVTVAAIMTATGWQQHSVRGFLAGAVRRKLALPLLTEQAEGGVRRYRIATADGMLLSWRLGHRERRDRIFATPVDRTNTGSPLRFVSIACQ